MTPVYVKYLPSLGVGDPHVDHQFAHLPVSFGLQGVHVVHP